MRRHASWLRYVLIVALAAVLVSTLTPLAASAVGRWLVVADRLEPAQAIVVLSGRVPFRAIQAASIYKAGFAPEVWISRPIPPPEEVAMRRLGLPDVRSEEERNQQVLERLGVPKGVIRVLGPGVLNTMEETDVILRELRHVGGERAILVTSKPHTRRVKEIWRTRVGGLPHVIVQFPVEEQFNPDRWWLHTADALEVSREVFGLVNVWAGFPVRPDRPDPNSARLTSD